VGTVSLETLYAQNQCCRHPGHPAVDALKAVVEAVVEVGVVGVVGELLTEAVVEAVVEVGVAVGEYGGAGVTIHSVWF